MSVQTQIDRLEAAKASIAAAIESKGVDVPGGTLLDDFGGYIEQIPVISLPSGYTKLPYIKSSGTQYIDTGYIPNQSTRILCSAIIKVSNEHTWLYGARQAVKKRGLGFVASSAGYYISAYNSEHKNFSPACNSDEIILIDQNMAATTIETKTTTETVSAAIGTFTAPVSLTLFAVNTNGTLTYGSASIYSCRIYDNGDLVRDFIPCLRDSDGRIGLYDMQNGVFYANNGTGDFSTESDLFLPAKDTLENMSWTDIQTVCKAGKASEYWSIGDTKMVELEGATYPVVIIGFDHDTPIDVASYGRAKAGATFQFYTLLDTSYPLDDANDGYGWPDTIFHTRYVPVFMSEACIDQEVAAVIVPVTKMTAGGNGGTAVATEDPMFLLSEIEVFGTRKWSFAGEGTQYDFYAAGNTKVKKKLNGTAYNWGLRSLRSGVTGYYCVVDTSGGSVYSPKTTATGTALAFCV